MKNPSIRTPEEIICSTLVSFGVDHEKAKTYARVSAADLANALVLHTKPDQKIVLYGVKQRGKQPFLEYGSWTQDGCFQEAIFNG